MHLHLAQVAPSRHFARWRHILAVVLRLLSICLPPIPHRR